MRKFLAVLLAVMLVMTASITAFGATKSDVEDKLAPAVDFALDGNYGKNGYTVDNAKYFLMYLKAGEDAAKYEDKYLASVKKALDGGKLTGVTALGLTLEIMDILGVNAKSFEGYDVVKMFKAADISDCAGSPYNYVYATEAAAAYGLDDFGKEICNYVIDNYYELGVGTDFWGGFGTSADDLSMFILTLAPYADYFAQYIDNAFMLIKAYACDKGYASAYGAADEADTDSTALVLAAQSAMDNKRAADKTVIKLAEFYNEATGGFTGAYDDYVATADVIFALGYYLPIADPDPEPETTTEATTAEPETEPETTTKAPATEAPATEKAPEATTAAPAAPEKSPETGAANGAAIAFASIALAGAAVMLAKKKESK